jgi:hypothetical protein
MESQAQLTPIFAFQYSAWRFTYTSLYSYPCYYWTEYSTAHPKFLTSTPFCCGVKPHSNSTHKWDSGLFKKKIDVCKGGQERVEGWKEENQTLVHTRWSLFPDLGHRRISVPQTKKALRACWLHTCSEPKPSGEGALTCQEFKNFIEMGTTSIVTWPSHLLGSAPWQA